MDHLLHASWFHVAPIQVAQSRMASQVMSNRVILDSSAVQLVKTWEGCSLNAYPDPASGGDPWTIGWGSTGPGICKGLVWTQAQADADMQVRVLRLAKQIQLSAGVPLNDNQLGALVSFAYNLGLADLTSSTLFRYVLSGDFAAAASQFGLWNHADGKVMPGLTKRRAAERAVFEGA